MVPALRTPLGRCCWPRPLEKEPSASPASGSSFPPPSSSAPEPLSFQLAQVLSAPSVSATTPDAAPVLCAGVTTASWLPSVFPRVGSPQTVSSERSLWSATLVASLLLGLRQCRHSAFRVKSEQSSWFKPRCVPAHRLPFTLHTSSLSSVFFLHLYFIDSKVGDVCLS